jgi:hypothetical protein
MLSRSQSCMVNTHIHRIYEYINYNSYQLQQQVPLYIDRNNIINYHTHAHTHTRTCIYIAEILKKVTMDNITI